MVKLLRGYFSPAALRAFRKDYEGAIIKAESIDISRGSGGRRHYRKVTRGQQLMLNGALEGPTPKRVVEFDGDLTPCVSRERFTSWPSPQGPLTSTVCLRWRKGTCSCSMTRPMASTPQAPVT